MDAYLQDSWHSTNADLLRQWLTPVLSEGHRHIYLIGDGSFSEASLTAGTLSWQPVFTTEPMSQYQEMGLFIAQIEPNDLGILKLINQLERFTGLPMFSLIVSDQSDTEITQMLTWLSDARTSDNLELYIRIGDSRCLPHILKSLNPVQKDYISYLMEQWYWPGRDGLWNQGFSMSKVRARLNQDAIPKTHNIITEQQFEALMNSGEIDLIHSLIAQMDDEVYPNDFSQHKKYLVLERLIHEAKQGGAIEVPAIRDYVLDRLIRIGR